MTPIERKIKETEALREVIKSIRGSLAINGRVAHGIQEIQQIRIMNRPEKFVFKDDDRVFSKIGIVSLQKAFENGMSVGDIADWSKKFHPRVYFGSYSSKNIDDQNFELWLCLKEDNPKVKGAITNNKLSKWKEKSKNILTLDS